MGKRQTLDWGIPLEQLPIIDWDSYQTEAKNGRALVAVAGVVHDVTDFIKDHPGGKALITSVSERTLPPSSTVVSTITPTPPTTCCRRCVLVLSEVDVRLRSGSELNGRTRTSLLFPTRQERRSFVLAVKLHG